MDTLRSSYDEGLGDDKLHVAIVSDSDGEKEKVDPVKMEVEDEEPSDGLLILAFVQSRTKSISWAFKILTLTFLEDSDEEANLSRNKNKESPKDQGLVRFFIQPLCIVNQV